MKKIILLTGILIALASINVSYAAQCLTEVDGTSSVTSATTGTDVQITVSSSGSDCTISQLQLTYDPSTLTISDPASPGYYSSISAGTSKTFTVTAGTADTYTITARGTTSDGSVDDNTPVIIDYVDPSALTVSGTPSSTSLALNANFTLSIDVQNAQADDIATSYTLSLPSGLTKLSGDPTSSTGTTVSAGSTSSFSWVIKHSTCFTGSKTITLQLGDNTAAFSATVTSSESSCGSGSSSSSSGGGGGGGGGGGNATNSTSKKLFFTKITPGNVTIVKITDASFGIKQVSIGVNNIVNSVQITVTKLDGQPAVVVKSVTGNVYQYFEINTSNINSSNVRSAKLGFSVPKSWIAANSSGPSSVSLQRYSGGDWQKLATTQTGETAGEYEFEADTPGFSFFAISADTPVVQQPPQQPGEQQPSDTTTPPASGASGETATVPAGETNILLYVFGFIIIIVIGAVYYKYFSKPKPYSFRTAK